MKREKVERLRKPEVYLRRGVSQPNFRLPLDFSSVEIPCQQLTFSQRTRTAFSPRLNEIPSGLPRHAGAGGVTGAKLEREIDR